MRLARALATSGMAAEREEAAPRQCELEFDFAFMRRIVAMASSCGLGVRRTEILQSTVTPRPAPGSGAFHLRAGRGLR